MHTACSECRHSGQVPEQDLIQNFLESLFLGKKPVKIPSCAALLQEKQENPACLRSEIRGRDFRACHKTLPCK